jgi:UDP-N-acetylmuramoyl-tripeptide--D-alanyl-D-alanine ligase
MLTASVHTMASVVSGTIASGRGDVVGNGLVVDSRSCEPGCLIAALSGEKADGHSFLADALERGARVLLVSEHAEASHTMRAEAERAGAAIVRVDDVLESIQALASWHRSRLHATVIGITGSTGKTTTKDLLKAVLGRSRKVVATEGNRNNDLGMPLTILAADAETDVLVLEMGMRGAGQIARLAEIARPDLGLVTNVGTSHIELLGTQEAVASAKGELVVAVPPAGRVFLNGDDAYSQLLAVDAVAPVTTYGLGPHCDVRAVGIELDGLSRPSFRLESHDAASMVTLGLPGRHNVYNALAAAAVGLAFGIDPQDVSAGLGEARVTKMRMETFASASGVTVINDAYNANPTSMRAALDALAEMKAEGRRVAVLGDMAELGSLSELAHFDIGEHLAKLSMDVLVTVGARASRIADGARAAGMDDGRIRPCATAEEASEVLDDLLEVGDIVLVKASRVMELERVVEGIVTPRVR